MTDTISWPMKRKARANLVARFAATDALVRLVPGEPTVVPATSITRKALQALRRDRRGDR